MAPPDPRTAMPRTQANAAAPCVPASNSERRSWMSWTVLEVGEVFMPAIVAAEADHDQMGWPDTCVADRTAESHNIDFKS